MAQTQTETDVREDIEEGARGVGAAVASVTQDAAGIVRNTAERAAARLPDAVAGAQVAATETQRVLDEMDNDALLIGTSFSVGLGVGLFLSGANRFLVAAALAPAAAMALTMFGRDQQSNSGSRAQGGTTRRARNGAATE